MRPLPRALPTQAELIADGFNGVLGEERGLFRAKGCIECAEMGYVGRVALYEVMPISGQIRT